MKERNYSEITKEIEDLASICLDASCIDPCLYDDYQVNRGLRDIHGNGVLTGLTEISEIISSKMVDGQKVPCVGELYYRGISINHLVDGFIEDERFGFEESVYLLLFGHLPAMNELNDFQNLLNEYRTLPTNFVRDVIMKATSEDMMNSLARSVLTLASYDSNADDISLANVVRQSLHLIAQFPLLCVYSYQAFNYYSEGESLVIHKPKMNLSSAENILYMLRPNKKYTQTEAKVLDLALVLHADHGGGNNSTFTCHVVTSSGTDTYSTIAAALASLKGPKHGGANIKVIKMFDDMKIQIKDWENEQEIEAYLLDLLQKKAFDKSGLIYGMGHAIYSLSDPRAQIFREYVEGLAHEKGRMDEFHLYRKVELLAPQVIARERKMYKGVSANIDFYSGFVYSMLDLPSQLYTPIFAMSRIAGWSAHRLEELINSNRIIRPAYKSVKDREEYTPIKER